MLEYPHPPFWYDDEKGHKDMILRHTTHICYKTHCGNRVFFSNGQPDNSRQIATYVHSDPITFSVWTFYSQTLVFDTKWDGRIISRLIKTESSIIKLVRLDRRVMCHKNTLLTVVDPGISITGDANFEFCNFPLLWRGWCFDRGGS